MKKNRTSWSDRGSEAMAKVISYIKSNLLEELITKKIKKVKIGKIKYATANSILENLTGFRKNKVKGLLRNKSFNEMRLI